MGAPAVLTRALPQDKGACARVLWEVLRVPVLLLAQHALHEWVLSLAQHMAHELVLSGAPLATHARVHFNLSAATRQNHTDGGHVCSKLHGSSLLRTL